MKPCTAAPWRGGRAGSRSKPRQRLDLPAYRIDRHLVTNADYARFVANTEHRTPFVSESVWRGYRLVHGYARVLKFLWRDGRPPAGREQHPVVLVSHADAAAYCAWRGARLPNEAEWEKAARGTDGRYFPWGDTFDAGRLNSEDGGPFDTVPVGPVSERAEPLRRSRHGGAGVRVDDNAVQEGAAEVRGEGRLVGRLSGRHAVGGAARPAVGVEARLDRLSLRRIALIILTPPHPGPPFKPGQALSRQGRGRNHSIGTGMRRSYTVNDDVAVFSSAASSSAFPGCPRPASAPP